MNSYLPVPTVTKAQMQKLDKISINDYGHLLIQMMELAGSKFAQVVQETHGKYKKLNVLCVSGTGNNGGGGFVASKHLNNLGHNVDVYVHNKQKFVTSKPSSVTDFKNIPLHQFNILQKLSINFIEKIDIVKDYDVVLDCLIGYGLTGHLRTDLEDLLNRIKVLSVPIISLDNATGFNAQSAKFSKKSLNATITVVIAAMKHGLTAIENKKMVGELYLADIGIPKEAYKKAKIDYPFYKNGKYENIIVI